MAKVISTVSQRAVWFPEVIHSISIIVPTKSTQFSLEAAENRGHFFISRTKEADQLLSLSEVLYTQDGAWVTKGTVRLYKLPQKCCQMNLTCNMFLLFDHFDVHVVVAVISNSDTKVQRHSVVLPRLEHRHSGCRLNRQVHVCSIDLAIEILTWLL